MHASSSTGLDSQQQPAQFLPLLYPSPSLALLAASLDRLEAIFAPAVVVDLTTSTQNDSSSVDEFESKFSRGWIERVVALAMKAIGSESKSVEGEGWEALVDRSATLLAALAGHCSAGSTTRTFLLPSPLQLATASTSTLFPAPPPLLISLTAPIALIIRDTTLLSSSTGFRTWGSAPLLARELALSPSSFFPSSPPAQSPLQVLELGSGTGLVGLTAAAVLHRLGHPHAQVHLTDFDSVALDNLRFNLRANAASLGGAGGMATTVSKLDWGDFVPPFAEGARGGEGERVYDVILAADVVYEPSHVSLVHSTIAALLRFPRPGAVPPACHLVLPLRRTHATEHTAFDGLFSLKGGTGRERSDPGGRRWRLVVRGRRDESATDGFGKRGEEREARYWVYRIEWERAVD